jgi:hypothetical protein
MRLSEAIATGRVTIEKWIAGEIEGCALGMAANGAGIEINYAVVERQWPWLKWVHPGGCPAWPCAENGEYNREDYLNLIGHIFDEHVLMDEHPTNQPWTLDQLIDWVRSVEPAEKEAPVVAEEQGRRLLVAK